MDYSDLNLTSGLEDKDSLAAKPSMYQMAIQNDLQEEKSAVKQNVIVTKQLYQSTLGGSVQFVSSKGGTVILSYDPKTGTITLNGGVIIGQTITIGTLNNAVIGTPSILGGTSNSQVVGTPVITGGTATSITLNNTTIGTPAITGGSHNSATFGTPNVIAGTFSNPKITGTENLAVNVGSSQLTNNGDFAIQSFGTAGVLAWRVGGTTWYVSPTGTLT